MDEEKGHYWTHFIEGFEAKWKIAPECPFCGSGMRKLESKWVQRRHHPHQVHRIVCNMCGAEGPEAETPDLALNAWSGRVKSTWEPLGPHSYVLPLQALGSLLVHEDGKNVSFIDWECEEVHRQVDINLGNFRICYRHRGTE